MISQKESFPKLQLCTERDDKICLARESDPLSNAPGFSNCEQQRVS